VADRISLGFSLLVLAVKDEVFRDLAFANVFNFFGHSWYIRILPGAGLLILAIVAALPLVLVPSRSSILAFSTPNGPIEISLKAVRDFVRQLCLSEPGVREVLDVQVHEGAGGVDIAIAVSIKEGHPVPMVCTRCQERSSQELGTTLGVERVGRVAVKVANVGVAKSAPGALPPLPKNSSFLGASASSDYDEDESREH
jgi:uncharacterized alkaline shock family protein YloU